MSRIPRLTVTQPKQSTGGSGGSDGNPSPLLNTRSIQRPVTTISKHVSPREQAVMNETSRRNAVRNEIAKYLRTDKERREEEDKTLHKGCRSCVRPRPQFLVTQSRKQEIGRKQSESISSSSASSVVTVIAANDRTRRSGQVTTATAPLGNSQGQARKSVAVAATQTEQDSRSDVAVQVSNNVCSVECQTERKLCSMQTQTEEKCKAETEIAELSLSIDDIRNVRKPSQMSLGLHRRNKSAKANRHNRSRTFSQLLYNHKLRPDSEKEIVPVCDGKGDSVDVNCTLKSTNIKSHYSNTKLMKLKSRCLLVPLIPTTPSRCCDLDDFEDFTPASSRHLRLMVD